METAAMRPQSTTVLPPTWPPTTTTPTTAPPPVFRPPSTPRRKTRPRSPDPASNSPALSHPSSQVSPATQVKPHPHSALPSTNAPEPDSSTAHHYTDDDDLDMTPDITSDKDYADSHKILQNAHKQALAPLHKPADPSRQISLLHRSPQISKKQPDAHLPHRPIWIQDSDISSDEEGDYRENYRRFLRRRTEEDEAREREVIDQVRRKRSRSGRRGKREENNLKRQATVASTFQTAEAQKNIRVTLTAAEMDHDLISMFGLEDDAVAVEGKHGKGDKRKRIESGHGGELAGGNKKRCISPSKGSKHKGKAVVTRAKVNAGKKVNSVSKAHAIKKKTSPVSVQGSGAAGKCFVKHKAKKGWSVCVSCGMEVWPPNCQKHLSACHRGQKCE